VTLKHPDSNVERLEMAEVEIIEKFVEKDVDVDI
jgi:hypothetical protein